MVSKPWHMYVCFTVWKCTYMYVCSTTEKLSEFLWGKLHNHSAVMVYARLHFGILRLPVRDIAQKTTWVRLRSRHKTAWAKLVKSTGWKTRWVEIRTPLSPGKIQECAERHFYTPEKQSPDSDLFINVFQAGRMVSFRTQRTLTEITSIP